MPRPPDNLFLSRFLFCPAELPGSGRFWTVWERLDGGDVLHARYLGLLPDEDGEATLLTRARERFPAPE